MKRKISKRVKVIANIEPNDANLIKAVKMKVIPVAAYAVNIC